MFAYLLALCGLLALISRVWPKLAPYHAAFGRWYLIFMFWCMGTSLLIYNTGLPLPIIISFVYLLVSITIGWNAIKLHTAKMARAVSERVNFRLNNAYSKPSQSEIDIDQITR